MRNVLVYAQPSTSSNVAFDGPKAIWRARLDGSRAKRIASGNYPAVSPDGRWIAFGRGAALFVMPVAGGAAAQVYTFTGRIAELAGAPTWAPNSRLLAFQGAYGPPIVLDPFSRRTHALPESAQAFAFSPDSRRLVYSQRDDLYVAPVLGGAAIRLTHGHASIAPVWGKPGIAFGRLTHDDGLRGDIWLSDGTGHRARRLTRTGVAVLPGSFSADGKKLLGFVGPMHDGRLWAIDVATGVERPLTPWIGMLYPRGLSADGGTVLAAVCNYESSDGEIETIPFAGGKPRVLVHGPCDASWNAR